MSEDIFSTGEDQWKSYGLRIHNILLVKFFMLFYFIAESKQQKINCSENISRYGNYFHSFLIYFHSCHTLILSFSILLSIFCHWSILKKSCGLNYKLSVKVLSNYFLSLKGRHKVVRMKSLALYVSIHWRIHCNVDSTVFYTYKVVYEQMIKLLLR